MNLQLSHSSKYLKLTVIILDIHISAQFLNPVVFLYSFFLEYVITLHIDFIKHVHTFVVCGAYTYMYTRIRFIKNQ